MKYTYLLFLIIPCFLGSCLKENVTKNMGPLDLHLTHKIYNVESPGLWFGFFGKNHFEQAYDLVFDYTINGQEILIELKDVVDLGDCPSSSRQPDGPSTSCIPTGDLFIPERLLPKGTYSVRLKTPHFEEWFQLVKDYEKYSLNLPINEHLSTTTTEVYVMPPNVLQVSVSYRNNSNSIDPDILHNKLRNAGFDDIVLANHNKLSLNTNKYGIVQDYSTNNSSRQRWLLSINNNFELAKDIIRNYTDQVSGPYNILLFSSNGDQARFIK